MDDPFYVNFIDNKSKFGNVWQPLDVVLDNNENGQSVFVSPNGRY